MNSDMNKMIECGGERGEGCLSEHREGRNNAEDNVTEDAKKDVYNAEDEDTEGTGNNDENKEEDKTQLNLKTTNLPIFTNFPYPHILPLTCPHFPTPMLPPS